MILFFYGEDTFRLKEKLRALKEKFISASLGDTNLAVLDGENLKYEELVRQILAIPFLSKKRLVIAENILLEGKKELQEKVPEVLAKVPESTVLVFVEEGAPDKRLALFKRLNKTGQAEYFQLLDEVNVKKWIKREVASRGGEIQSPAVDKLSSYIGSDLWRQSNEIDKLLAYQKEITLEAIELMVNPQIEANIFDLIDQIARKNLPEATKELYKLLNSGQNEIYIFTMIVYQYRNLIILKDMEERVGNNRWALAKKAGLHPFIVQKSQLVLGKYTLDDLKEIYRLLLDVDFKIKTGKLESRTAIEMLIFELTKENPKY